MTRYLLLLNLITIFYACNNDDTIQRLSPGLDWSKMIEERERRYVDFDTNSYDTTIQETPLAIQEDLNGNIFVAHNGYIQTYNSSGNIIQTDSVSFDIHGIQPLSNGNYFTFGINDSTQNMISIVNTSFNEVWTEVFTTPTPSFIKLVLTIDNDIYLVSNVINSFNSWVTKIDENGNVVWQITLTNHAQSIAIANDDNILISSTSPLISSAQVTKISPTNGDILMTQNFGNSFMTKAIIKTNSTDNYMLTTSSNMLSSLYRFDDDLNELERLDAGINVLQFEVNEDEIVLVNAQDGRPTNSFLPIPGKNIELNIKKITNSGEHIWEMFFPVESTDRVENIELISTTEDYKAILLYTEKSYFLLKTNPE